MNAENQPPAGNSGQNGHRDDTSCTTQSSADDDSSAGGGNEPGTRHAAEQERTGGSGEKGAAEEKTKTKLPLPPALRRKLDIAQAAFSKGIRKAQERARVKLRQLRGKGEGDEDASREETRSSGCEKVLCIFDCIF